MELDNLLPAEASHGLRAFARERVRQVRDLGHTPEHDKGHDPAELIAAGCSYIEWALAEESDVYMDSPPFIWPWDDSSWKPATNTQRNLEKGGALIAAAYDLIEEELTSLEG